jgi:hypothetical protein
MYAFAEQIGFRLSLPVTRGTTSMYTERGPAYSQQSCAGYHWVRCVSSGQDGPSIILTKSALAENVNTVKKYAGSLTFTPRILYAFDGKSQKREIAQLAARFPSSRFDCAEFRSHKICDPRLDTFRNSCSGPDSSRYSLPAQKQ